MITSPFNKDMSNTTSTTIPAGHTQMTIVINSHSKFLRASSALDETRRLLRKEKGYSPDLRNDALIAQYNNHIKKLDEALDAYSQMWSSGIVNCLTCGKSFTQEDIEQIECKECFKPWNPDCCISGTEVMF